MVEKGQSLTIAVLVNRPKKNTMSRKNTLFLSTRKGLIVCSRRSGGWAISESHFDGIPVTFTYEDERNGAWWAALDHGHWGVGLPAWP